MSQEAALAGKAAAEWLKENGNNVTEADLVLEQAEKQETAAGRMQAEKTAITVEPGAHVRYTVPSKIRPDKAGEETLIRFRVDNVLKDHYLCVSYDGELISRKKKRILAPGEMEQAVIRHSDLEKYPELIPDHRTHRGRIGGGEDGKKRINLYRLPSGLRPDCEPGMQEKSFLWKVTPANAAVTTAKKNVRIRCGP